MKTTKILAILLLALGLVVCLPKVAEAVPMGTAWTYQGRLMDANETADGEYDFQFKLYDASVRGSKPANDVNVGGVDVIDGYFTVELDFGSDVFDGDARWLEIDVRPGDSNDVNDFVTLSPRQEVTSTPYAIYAQTSGTTHSLGAIRGDMNITGDITSDGTINALGFGAGSSTYRGDGWIRVYGNEVYNPTNDLVFKSGGGTPGPDPTLGKELMRLTGGGNLGIGTSSPEVKLSIQMRGSPISPSDVGGLLIKDAMYNSGNQLEVQGPIGNTKFIVDAVGKVGIGTDSPEAALHVKGAGWPNSFMYLQSDADQDAGIRLYEGDTVKWHLFNMSAAGGLRICNSDFSKDVFFAKQSNGKVGIGTTNPHDGKLVIANDATDEAYISLQPGGTALNDFMGLRVSESGNNTTKLHLGREFTSNTSFWDQVTLDGANGNVGIGTTNPTRKLDVRGNILVRSEGTGLAVLELGEGLDYAEGFDVTEEAHIRSGMVLVIDAENPGKLTVSRSAYDSKVAGIVAGANGMGSGVRLGVGQFDYDVALAGRVYCKVDATEAAVQPGDLLTTSATPGHAMKATDYGRANGTILGKAMEKLEKGQKGQILVLVTLQ